MNSPQLIDLFCGCGGLTLGAARAGFHIATAIDCDERALATHRRNFPGTQHVSTDIATCTGTQILESAALKQGQVDVLAGGPPCQGFSTIGKRDASDKRNELVGHFFRLVAELKPKIFVMENVPGVLNKRFSHLLNPFLSEISRDYTSLEPMQIKAVDVGAPTVRTRVVVIGYRSDSFAFDKTLFEPNEQAECETPRVRAALDGLPFDIHPDASSSRGGKRTVKIERTGPFFEAATGKIPTGVGDQQALEMYTGRSVVTGCLGTVHSPELERRYDGLKYGQSDVKTKSVRLDPNGYCPTLRAGTGPEHGSFQAVRPIHYRRPRVITPREAARLQGFPDWFQFDPTKWHSFRQIGNSVSPLVAEFIFSKLSQELQDA